MLKVWFEDSRAWVNHLNDLFISFNVYMCMYVHVCMCMFVGMPHMDTTACLIHAFD